ncbi:MAG: hypothetical protein E7159_01235 [Firmicutes bacterium]|nr:hypothetical protein [Bacillota bacterium]
MIKTYNIEELNKYGSFEVALVNNKLVDVNSAFNGIYNLGKKWLDDSINKHKSISNSFVSLFNNYWLSNKDKLHNEYKSFCTVNSNLLDFNEIDTPDFVYYSMYIALIDNIFNLSSKLLISIEYKDFNPTYFNYLLKLLDYDSSLIDNNVEGYYDDMILMFNTLQKDSKSYTDDEIKDIIKSGVKQLEKFLIDLLKGKRYSRNFYIDNFYTIYINDEPFICNKASNIIAVCLNKLALKISKYNLDHRYIQCKYYKCLNYFHKDQNRKEFCPECIKNKIPIILKNQKYNNKRSKNRTND